MLVDFDISPLLIAEIEVDVAGMLTPPTPDPSSRRLCGFPLQIAPDGIHRSRTRQPLRVAIE